MPCMKSPRYRAMSYPRRVIGDGHAAGARIVFRGRFPIVAEGAFPTGLNFSLGTFGWGDRWRRVEFRSYFLPVAGASTWYPGRSPGARIHVCAFGSESGDPLLDVGRQWGFGSRCTVANGLDAVASNCTGQLEHGALARTMATAEGLEFLYNLNRFNVATSRARCARIVFGSPRLLSPECGTPRQKELANALRRYTEMSEQIGGEEAASAQ